MGRASQDDDRYLLTASLNVSDADGAQTDTALITVGAGLRVAVKRIEVTADGATTGDTQCRIGFGTANTPAVDAAGVLMSHSGIVAGSGVVMGDGHGTIGIGADNEDLRVTCEDPSGGALDITIGYITIPS